MQGVDRETIDALHGARGCSALGQQAESTNAADAAPPDVQRRRCCYCTIANAVKAVESARAEQKGALKQIAPLQMAVQRCMES